MASILKGRPLALALVLLIVVSSSFQTITVANARSSNNIARQLATDCDSPIQSDIPGCGSGGGGGGSGGGTPRRGGGGRTPSRPKRSSSRCRKGCCGGNKFGDCICCK